MCIPLCMGILPVIPLSIHLYVSYYPCVYIPLCTHRGTYIYTQGYTHMIHAWGCTQTRVSTHSCVCICVDIPMCMCIYFICCFCFCVCRFSSFVKTGSEGYILGHVPNKIAIKHSDKLKIIASPESKP